MKENLTYQQALAIVEKEEQRIKSLRAALVFGDPVDVDKEVGFYSTIKAISFSLVGTLSLPAVVIAAPEVISVHSTFPLAILCMAIAASSTGIQAFPSLARFLSPNKYKKMKSESVLAERFRSLKEQQFTEIETQALKNAQKALTVINSELQDSNLKMIYRSDEDFHGFAFISIPKNKQVTST